MAYFIKIYGGGREATFRKAGIFLGALGSLEFCVAGQLMLDISKSNVNAYDLISLLCKTHGDQMERLFTYKLSVTMCFLSPLPLPFPLPQVLI